MLIFQMNLCRMSAKIKGTIDKTIFRKRIISFVMVSGNNISDFHARGGAIISTLKLLTAVGRVVHMELAEWLVHWAPELASRV